MWAALYIYNLSFQKVFFLWSGDSDSRGSTQQPVELYWEITKQSPDSLAHTCSSEGGSCCSLISSHEMGWL